MGEANKSFCFRCGGEPKYQLELTVQLPDGKVEQGPFWPLCYKCFLQIEWTPILRATVKGMETPRG